MVIIITMVMTTVIIPAATDLKSALLGRVLLLPLAGRLPGTKSGGMDRILVVCVRLLLSVCRDLLLGWTLWLEVLKTGTWSAALVVAGLGMLVVAGTGMASWEPLAKPAGVSWPH